MAATELLIQQVILARDRGGRRINRPKGKATPKRQMVLGNLTIKRFKQVVPMAFNMSSRTGQGVVLYRGRRRLGKLVLLEKLYQAKRGFDNKMFSTFHHPTGARLFRQAKLPSILERSDVAFQG